MGEGSLVFDGVLGVDGLSLDFFTQFFSQCPFWQQGGAEDVAGAK
jgi:hypothetical protein